MAVDEAVDQKPQFWSREHHRVQQLSLPTLSLPVIGGVQHDITSTTDGHTWGEAVRVRAPARVPGLLPGGRHPRHNRGAEVRLVLLCPSPGAAFPREPLPISSWPAATARHGMQPLGWGLRSRDGDELDGGIADTAKNLGQGDRRRRSSRLNVRSFSF
jgi:hypothetical protein